MLKVKFMLEWGVTPPFISGGKADYYSHAQHPIEKDEDIHELAHAISAIYMQLFLVEGDLYFVGFPKEESASMFVESLSMFKDVVLNWLDERGEAYVVEDEFVYEPSFYMASSPKNAGNS